MSVAPVSSAINTIALLDSIHRFVAEIELRADAIEIMNIESAMRDLTLERELNRRKAAPVPLPRVRRIVPLIILSMIILSMICLAYTAKSQSPPVVISPAGTYTIITPGPTSVVWTANSVTLSWGTAPDPGPAPAPVSMPLTPAPDPGPAPAPVSMPLTPAPVPVLTGHVWALAVYDPAVALPAAQQAALTSASLKASALLQDIDIQPFKSTDPIIASYLPVLPKSGLPAVLFVQKSQDGTGELAYAMELPNSQADFLILVNKVRGK